MTPHFLNHTADMPLCFANWLRPMLTVAITTNNVYHCCSVLSAGCSSSVFGILWLNLLVFILDITCLHICILVLGDLCTPGFLFSHRWTWGWVASWSNHHRSKEFTTQSHRHHSNWLHLPEISLVLICFSSSCSSHIRIHQNPRTVHQPRSVETRIWWCLTMWRTCPPRRSSWW